MADRRTGWLGRIVVALGLVGGLTVACSVEVDLAGKACPCPSGLLCDTAANKCVTVLPAAIAETPPPAACNGASCKCAGDEDCKDPRRRFCGPDKTCVECLGAPNDTCTAGGYCNDKSQCTIGCKADGDCPSGQRCQATTHRCIACLVDADCASAGAGKKCSPSGACVDSCSGNGTTCGTGGTCCGGFCLPLGTDVLNCGGCGNACSTANGSATCEGGRCTWQCADGYAHCGPPQANTGCETDIRTVNACGACGVACTPSAIVFAEDIACGGDRCTYRRCQDGHFDQDRDPNNGCERVCGGKNQICCPGQRPCESGAPCRGNGTCPP